VDDVGWQGRLLVATPLLTDGNFHRAVVLLLSHEPDEGALGLVLDRPSGTGVSEVLPGWEALAAEPGLVFEGGPVSPTSAVCLGSAVPGAPPTAAFADLAADPLLGTVDLDASPEELTGAVRQVRVFAGYAGWSAGQLEDEVAEGAWWVLDALPGDPFTPAPRSLWRQVVRRQGLPLALAATAPDDPSLN
jgi:putative transcriptional regulator